MKMDNKFKLLIYKSAVEEASVEVVLKDETIWATQKAEAEYDVFNRTQKILSDFDKLLENITTL